MTFELDARRLAGKSVVVFERLYDEEEHLIAKEEDIEMQIRLFCIENRKFRKIQL